MKYLQLRVQKLRCVKITKNRQNFMGISLENDPDSIDIAAIVTDPQHGLTVAGAPIFLGNRYVDGKVENFGNPKVIAEIPVQETDSFPRLVAITLNMAEKDDGAGFFTLVDQVAGELAEELSESLEGALDLGAFNQTVYSQVESIVKEASKALFTELGNLLGLGDDPFTPQNIRAELASYSATPPAAPMVVPFREPNSAHNGLFELTCAWHMSDESAMLPGSVSGGSSSEVRTARAALKRAGVYSAPQLRTHRFAKPLKAQQTLVKVKVPVKRPHKHMWLSPVRPLVPQVKSNETGT